MMEEVDRYYQGNITLEEAENYIASGLVTAARAYVANGYYLRRIRDDRLYEEAGYKNFEEYVRAKYNKDKGWASKCIKVNQELSADGNSPILISNYQDYSVYQLVEIAYMTEEQREEADPDMTVQALKEIRNPKPVPEEKVVISQLEERSAEPEPDAEAQQIEESIAISQQDTLPDMDYDLRREYCEAAAVKLIEAEFDWLKADYMNRVLKVDESEKQLKESLVGKGAWYFKDPRGNGIAHVNLFQDCIQFYDEKYWVGDCDWFYLCAAVQSMWNVVALKKAQDEQNNNPDQEPQAWKTNPTPCIYREGYSCTVPETQKYIPGGGSNCGRSCCWECTKRGECKWECNSSQLRPEEPEQVEPEPDTPEIKPEILHVYEDQTPDESWKFGSLPQAKEKYIKNLACVLVEKKGKRLRYSILQGDLSDETVKWRLEDLADETDRAIEIGDDVIAYPCAEIIEFSRGNEDLGTCSYTRFGTQVRKVFEEWRERQDSAAAPVKSSNPEPVMDAEYEEIPQLAKELKPARPYTLEEVEKEIERTEAIFLGVPEKDKQSVPYRRNIMRLDAMRLLYDSMKGE